MNSPTVEDLYRVAAAAWEIRERIIYFSQPGRPLAGLNFDYNGDKQVRGESDLPFMEPYSIEWDEDIFAGAPRTYSKKTANTPIQTTQTLRYRVGFSKRDGFVRTNPLIPAEAKGALEWMALILDAIESSRTNPPEPDAKLAGTLASPIGFRYEESEPTELAFHSILVVTLPLAPTCRAERSTIPEIMP